MFDGSHRVARKRRRIRWCPVLCSVHFPQRSQIPSPIAICSALSFRLISFFRRSFGLSLRFGLGKETEEPRDVGVEGDVAEENDGITIHYLRENGTSGIDTHPCGSFFFSGPLAIFVFVRLCLLR